jgi:hypothetical protein
VSGIICEFNSNSVGSAAIYTKLNKQSSNDNNDNKVSSQETHDMPQENINDEKSILMKCKRDKIIQVEYRIK